VCRRPGGDPVQLLGGHPACGAIDAKARYKQPHLFPRPPREVAYEAILDVIISDEASPAGAAEIPVYPRQFYHDFLDLFIVLGRLTVLIEKVDIAGFMIWNSNEPSDRMFLHVYVSFEGIHLGK